MRTAKRSRKRRWPIPVAVAVVSALFAVGLAGQAATNTQRHFAPKQKALAAELNRLRPGRALLTYVPPTGGLCLVRADGSHRVRLTARRDVSEPAWSPRGRYVAFHEHAGSSDGITVANARGRVLWVIGANGPRAGAILHSPLWSPDGRNIAYYRGAAGPPWWYELVVSRPSGAQTVVIGGSMDPVGDATDPAWAPDGERLAFDGGEHIAGAVTSIFSVPANGGDWRLLVRSAEHPAYSPDGSKLAYVALDERGSAGIFIADADGGNPRALAAGPAVYSPVWSSDGSLVAFERLDLVNGQGWQLVVAEADGTGERVLTSGLSFSGGPLGTYAWSPSGKLIAFYKQNGSLVVARADGTGTRVVVKRVRQFAEWIPPTWRPAVALPAVERRPCR